MRRPVLLTLATLGGVVSLVGVGLFSSLTDTAHTGTNSAASAGLPKAADIQLAAATLDATVGIQCGEFSEDLGTGLFSLSNLQPGDDGGYAYFCLENVGSQAVDLTVGVDELTDQDGECTGDESEFDDSCGSAGAVGELSSVLLVQNFSYSSCADPSPQNTASTGQVLSQYTQVPSPIGYDGNNYPSPLPAGATACFALRMIWNPTASDQANQQAQSDSVTWKFRFDAQA